MFAEVIPIRRTPFGLDGFDYSFDETKTSYHVGQFVYILLRGHTTEAVIRSIKPTSAFASRAKPIVGPIPASLTLPPTCLELLTWVAERTFSSLPTVLHAWLDTLPKRFPKQETPTREAKTFSEKTGSAHAYWSVDHETELIGRAKEALNQGQRVLILTPWTQRIDLFRQALQAVTPDPLPLHGDLAHGAYFANWSRCVSGESPCVIATRLGAWLAPTVDLVLIDEPENDDHKQDEQAPRYDARRIAGWAAKYAGVRVEAFGLTPPLHANTAAPDLDCALAVHAFHPGGRSATPSIQADTALAIQEHEGPTIVIHPIRGRAGRLTCRDCSWQATCAHCGAPVAAEETRAVCRSCSHTQALPLTCDSCGSADLGKAIPGIEQLKKAWSRAEPAIVIDWRDTTNELLEQPIPPKSLVALTLSHLFGGAIEDVRRTERRMIAARRLMNRVRRAEGRLIIQTPEQDLETWPSWKTTDGVKRTSDAELETRRLFHYPPTWRRVKCLIDGTETTVATWLTQAKQLLREQGTIEGPFPVEFRRPGSGARSVVHLLFSPEISESSLVELLQPLATSALIDLDPIAFFK